MSQSVLKFRCMMCGETSKYLGRTMEREAHLQAYHNVELRDALLELTMRMFREWVAYE